MTTEQKLKKTRNELDNIKDRAAFVFDAMYAMVHLQQEGFMDISIDALNGFAIESISLVADMDRLKRIGEEQCHSENQL